MIIELEELAFFTLHVFGCRNNAIRKFAELIGGGELKLVNENAKSFILDGVTFYILFEDNPDFGEVFTILW